MKTVRANSSHRGFTLIELMIAMLIGVFLMAGVIQIFLSAKQAYRLQENLSRLQENGRFAMDILTKDVRMAGYAGCASKVKPNSIVKDPNKIPLINTGITGINDAKSSDALCTTYQCLLGTDIISFQSASSCGGQVTKIKDAATLQINTPNTCGILQDDIVIISSCTSADVFGVSNVGKPNSPSEGETVTHGVGTNLNTDSKLIGTYTENDSEILTAKLTSYFIRSGAGGIPSLWNIDSAKAGGTAVELIEGIENMQILYGVDTPDPTTGNYDYVPNYYVIAPSVTDWTKVVSIRISLLAVTIENNLTDTPQPYFYNGTTTPPQIPVLKTDTSQYCQAYTGTLPTNCQLVDDRRIHRVFSSTIAVRNRLP